MRSFRLRNTARFSTVPNTTATAFLVPASLLLCCLPVHAASNSASATLRIQVSVIPIVQGARTPASNGGPTESISYNLQPQRTQPAVSQTGIQVMPTQKLQKLSSSTTVVNDQPAVLQTLTIVGE
jgi:hypothetical protein